MQTSVLAAAADPKGFDTGSIAWVLISAALVFLMTPALAFFYDDAEKRPHVTRGGEVITAVANLMHDLHQAHFAQLLEAIADVRACNTKCLGDFFGVHWTRHDIKQGVDLCHAAVYAPARAHLAPVQDELFTNGIEFHQCRLCFFVFSVNREIGISKCLF